MSDIKNRLNKLSNLVNFQAKNLSLAIDKIEQLSEKLAQHTILVITYPDSDSVPHWRSELITWLNKIKSANKVRTPSGKLSISKLSGILYEQPLGLLTDIKNTYQEVIGSELNIAPNSVDVSNINFENYMISLGAIYDDYINFISGNMTESELKDRMEKFYLYSE